MRTSTAALASGLAATAAAAETIHGVLVFTRHGDRTTKHYGNTQQLTSLGAEQCFQSGSFYRSRYLSPESPTHISGIDGEQYTRSQIYATAPDADILLNTATAFLQGLYPPLNSEGVTTLNNGTKISSPLSNYQYVTLHGVSASSPDAIWQKGDDSCPAAAAAQSNYKKSEGYLSLLSSTKAFYESFYPYLSAVYDYPAASSLSYAGAYDIFDLINVARIHNSTGPAKDISAEDLFQLRTLADQAEFNTNYNASEPARQVGARSLAGAVLTHLGDTVSKGQRKFTLLTGSYDTFLAWFGWAGLTEASPDFFGLPDYAGSMVFEVFSDDEADGQAEKRVRFLFRNGTEDAVELKSYPLFGLNKPDLTWTEFQKVAKEKGSISGPEEWCSICESRDGFCKMYDSQGSSSEGVKIKNGGGGGMDGEMIAGIVLIVVGGLSLLAAVAMWAFVNSMRKKTKGENGATSVVMNAGHHAKGWDSASSTKSHEKVTV